MFKYIDHVSFYAKGLDEWHYREAEFQDWNFQNRNVLYNPVGVLSGVTNPTNLS